MNHHQTFEVSLRELTDEGEFCQDNLDPWLREHANFTESELESISHVHIQFLFKADEKQGQENAD